MAEGSQPPGDSESGAHKRPEAPPLPPAQRPARRPRVTLDFSGPPLSLPGERGEPADLVPVVEHAAVVAGTVSVSGLPLPPGTALTARPSRTPAPGEAARDAWLSSREAPLEDGSIPPSSAAGITSSRPPGVRPVTTTRPAPPSDQGRRRSPSTDALELVEQSMSMPPEVDLPSEMADRYALGDFTGALTIAELILGQRPDDETAQRYAEGSRLRLIQFYTSRLGPLDRVPDVAVPDSEIRWLGLDHQAAFLLSRVDGRTTVEEILHVVPMPHLDALKSLAELLDDRVIVLKDD